MLLGVYMMRLGSKRFWAATETFGYWKVKTGIFFISRLSSESVSLIRTQWKTRIKHNEKKHVIIFYAHCINGYVVLIGFLI